MIWSVDGHFFEGIFVRCIQGLRMNGGDNRDEYSEGAASEHIGGQPESRT